MKLEELLIFEVSGVDYAVPLSAVEEVVTSGKITQLPNAPPFLLGLSAVRGKIMVVIDSAKRYGLTSSPFSYFLVCHVRGNITAITIDRAVVAGEVPVEELPAAEVESLRAKCKLDRKFVRGGYELFEKGEKDTDLKAARSTGIRCLLVDPDLFVSDEMASRVGEVA